MPADPPRGGRVRVPCDRLTASRIETLPSVDIHKNRDGFDIRCSLDDPLLLGAADRCAVAQIDDLLVADLKHKAQRLRDLTPRLSDEAVDHQGRPYLWPKPHLELVGLPRFSLATSESPATLHQHLVSWLEHLPPIDRDRFAHSTGRWFRRLEAVSEEASAKAESVRDRANPEHQRELDSALRSLQVRALDGGNPDFDVEMDYEGNAYVPTRAEFVNREIDAIWDLAQKIVETEQDESRKSHVQGEVEELVMAHLDDLPDRIKLIVEADLLSQSLGAARAALLELLRPGWDWADDRLRNAVNPPEEVVQALLNARLTDEAAELEFRPRRAGGGGSFVLTSTFLGRKIVTSAEEVSD